MNKCKIVEDLLPLYIEELTSGETGAFIRTHLAECEACAAMHRRMTAPVREEAEKVNYKKTLRLNLLKIVGQVLLVLSLIVGAQVYFLWETGRFPAEKAFDSPAGDIRLELSDREKAGLFSNEPGMILIFTYKDEIGTFVNRYETDWADLEVFWTPDGDGMALFIENQAGETEIRVLEQEGLPPGGTEEIPGLYPAMEEPDLAARMEALLGSIPGLQGRELGAIEFRFDMWSEDSQRLYFNFTTAENFRGRIRFDCVTKELTVTEAWLIQAREIRIPVELLETMEENMRGITGEVGN